MMTVITLTFYALQPVIKGNCVPVDRRKVTVP